MRLPRKKKKALKKKGGCWYSAQLEEMNNEFLKQAAELALHGSNAWYSKEVLDTHQRFMRSLGGRIKIEESTDISKYTIGIDPYEK